MLSNIQHVNRKQTVLSSQLQCLLPSLFFPCYLIPYLVSLNPGEWAVPPQHTLHCLMTTTFKHEKCWHFIIWPAHTEKLPRQPFCWTFGHCGSMITPTKNNPKHLYEVPSHKQIYRSVSVRQHSSTLWMPGTVSQELWDQMAVEVFGFAATCVVFPNCEELKVKGVITGCFNLGTTVFPQQVLYWNILWCTHDLLMFFNNKRFHRFQIWQLIFC